MLQFDYGKCKVTPECSFDFDLCGWTQDKTDDFDWTRNANNTGSSGTGPTRDHTYKAVYGKYVHIEASSKFLSMITLFLLLLF